MIDPSIAKEPAAMNSMSADDIHPAILVLEVKRFGFRLDDFRLDIKRLSGAQRITAPAASFAVTVENLRVGRAATYLGGPGRAWVAEFVADLRKGAFGRP